MGKHISIKNMHFELLIHFNLRRENNSTNDQSIIWKVPLYVVTCDFLGALWGEGGGFTIAKFTEVGHIFSTIH